ncbi:hypothetical protein [Massilia orientalis]|uniref:Uncharacterized protein n=1 Tax=Massilia orientalis TaxID=3050128 RepID=A0ACC7MLW0_9BURK|nr:hypothetical protein [Massilia sp. YIM B02787]
MQSAVGNADHLVMAWARDRATGELKYILELKETGSKCNCVCISCGQSLTAVNAGKQVFSRRPHFRHPDGMPKAACVVLTARAALAAAFEGTDVLQLPRRRRRVHVEGFSGKLYEAWVDHPPETVRIVDVQFTDPLRGLLKLDDGREIEVLLVGSTSLEHRGNAVASVAIVANETEIAAMPIDEIRKRIVAVMDEHCWCGHWNDPALDAQALQQAYELAAAALDWDPSDELPVDATPAMRRETLLHKLVKEILQANRCIALPAHPTIEVTRELHGRPITRSQAFPTRRAELAHVALERRVGHIVPDVIATELDGTTLLVEVTVTNAITQERRVRIAATGFPAIEIDIGSMGGTITRSALVDFVVNETAAKRWLHHPEAVRAADLLKAQLDDVCAQQDQLRLAIEAVAHDSPPEVWAALFLEAATHMFRARQASRQRPSADADRHEEALRGAAIALACHGYPEAGDSALYGAPAMLIERLLSIRDDTGVGYAEGTCWEVISRIRQDTTGLRQWHPVYLMAIRTYAPALTALQEESIAKWRDEVANSIRWGNDVYVRDGRYDRLLALLFPEMGERLCMPQRPPVKTTAEPSNPGPAPASRPSQPSHWGSRDLEKLRPSVDYDPRTYALRGAALERWKRANPEMAKSWFRNDDDTT